FSLPRPYPCALFSFHATAPTAIYTLSLHDALPISQPQPAPVALADMLVAQQRLDLVAQQGTVGEVLDEMAQPRHRELDLDRVDEDRKSTRLNSSHVKISYAVFCLKKKKTTENDSG